MPGQSRVAIPRSNRANLTFAASVLKRIAPLCAMVLALLGLNFCLHTRVAPQTLERLTLPYWNTFEQTNFDWATLKNAWRLERGWLRATGAGGASVQSRGAVTPGLSYRALVTAHLEPGSSAGVLFGGQTRGKLERTHRVRLVSREHRLALQCGYFDQDGLFQLQDEVSVPASSHDARLEIEVNADAYSARLDGRRVLEAQPLKFVGGLPGIELSGPSAIGEVLIRPGLSDGSSEASAPPAPSLSPPRAPVDNLESVGWQALSGSWSLGSSGLTQSDARDFDRVTLYKTTPFTLGTLRVRLRHTRGAGAGILFAAPDSAGVQGAQLVRYSDDGRVVFWGAFDAAGRFVGRGNRTVRVPGVRAHTLEVMVRAGGYAIRLDGVELARSVRLENSAGFIGLSTSKSAATFTRVTVASLEAGKTHKERDLVQTKPESNR